MAPAVDARPAAEAVLARFQHRGFTLEAASGRLWVSPADKLSDADAATIRRFRDALYALVAGDTVDAAADPASSPAPRGGRETVPAFAQESQLGEHAAAVTDRRRALLADDGTPSPCTDCGAPSLRNGTRLCPACWDAWQARSRG